VLLAALAQHSPLLRIDAAWISARCGADFGCCIF
jgi:hypothetical protein